MTLERLHELALEAGAESALNRIKDQHNHNCAAGEHRTTSIAAFLRYCGAMQELVKQTQYA